MSNRLELRVRCISSYGARHLVVLAPWHSWQKSKNFFQKISKFFRLVINCLLNFFFARGPQRHGKHSNNEKLHPLNLPYQTSLGLTSSVLRKEGSRCLAR
jgi:hypothetical protein